MTHIPGSDRSQLLLLPETIDDYVAADNPVRFIDAFVDGLDLKAAGFERVEAKATGRPGYAPGDLLKLYIYGYLNRGPTALALTEYLFVSNRTRHVFDTEAGSAWNPSKRPQ